MGRVTSLGKRLSALEAKAPHSPWDLDSLSDGEIDELARLLGVLEVNGRDFDGLAVSEFEFLLTVQDRCWLGQPA